MTEYEALKALGHSPAKAAEIVLDASRGDELSIHWIASAQGIAARSDATGTGAAEGKSPVASAMRHETAAVTTTIQKGR